MTRTLLILVAVIALISCKKENPPAPAPTPPTVQEAETFAKQFAGHMSPCNPVEVDRMIDADVLVTRTVANRQISSAQVSQFRREIRGQMGTMLCAQVGKDKYTYLRTQMIDGTPRPLFRVHGEVGVNYVQLELDKTTGQIRVADLYIYMTGEKMSETFGNLVDTLLGSSSVGTTALKIQRVKSLMGSKDFAGAHGELLSLPAEIRRSKPIMLMEVQITSDLNDDAQYLKAIDAYAKAFPNDPSLDLVQVDSAIIRKKFDEAIAIVDRLDKRLGGDPYLDVIRAGTYAENGKQAEALAAAKKATTAEPTLETAWWQLLTLQSSNKHFRGAITSIETLRDKFSAVTDDDALRADARFTDLVASKEYAAWRAKAAPTPK